MATVYMFSQCFLVVWCAVYSIKSKELADPKMVSILLGDFIDLGWTGLKQAAEMYGVD
jgi:hypothetical protein